MVGAGKWRCFSSYKNPLTEAKGRTGALCWPFGGQGQAGGRCEQVRGVLMARTDKGFGVWDSLRNHYSNPHCSYRNVWVHVLILGAWGDIRISLGTARAGLLF